jgi:L-lactate dehydrogenase complex protein LldG
MSTDRVDAFADAARATRATVTTTAAAEADEALAEAVESPAVGTPPGIDGVSLPGSVVTGPSPSEIEAAATGVTAAGLGLADHGAVVVESTPAGEDHASLFPRRHVAVLRASDVVADLGDGLDYLHERATAGGDAVLVAGPSATADMGELVIGAHGPSELVIVVVTDR